jgi:enamine deaminase RidA (YjgF/YER057c/UK114 family)
MQKVERYHKTGRMSRIVVHGDTIYLCGQTCKDSTKGIKEQTTTTLEKVEEFLAEVGSDKSKILFIQIFLKDMNDFAAMNEVYDAWVDQENTPARACVEGVMARQDLLVEMVVTAHR